MKQSNLKKKNLSKKPFQKKKVSFGVLAVEKNPKSETLVIAKEQSDRSNLTPWRHPEQSEGSLYRSPRFARNDKSAGAWNFKSWHKVSAPEKARRVEYLNYLYYNNEI